MGVSDGIVIVQFILFKFLRFYFQYNFDSIGGLYSNSSMKAVPSGRRLLVKIVKGEGLKNAKEPYCVIEMDEPQQKNQTAARSGMNPFWDEHFLL